LAFLLIKNLFQLDNGHPNKYLFNVEAEAGKDQARHPYKYWTRMSTEAHAFLLSVDLAPLSIPCKLI
jgi:hypothetical protein